MGEFVGVTTFSVPDLAELKQQALLFDRIAVPGLASVLESGKILDEREYAEFRWLTDKGVIFTAEIPVDEHQMAELRRVEKFFAAEPNYFTRFAAEQFRSELSIDAVALESAIPLGSRKYRFNLATPDSRHHACAFCLPKILPHGDPFFTPDLSQGLILSLVNEPEASHLRRPLLWPRRSQPLGSKDTVVDVVLKRFPYIDDATPWERVLEFRNDADAKLRRNLLRKWIRQLMGQSLKPLEIEQEIDCLLSEYEEHMRKHEMAIRHGTLRTVIVNTAAFAEDFAKLRWGKIAESMFSLTERRTTLMQEELKAPGREISYLLTVNKAFSQVLS